MQRTGGVPECSFRWAPRTVQHRNPYFGTIGDIKYSQPIINAIGDFGNSDSRISLIFKTIPF
ncbi:MAG TPA: hypothetical protein DHU26_05880 [Spirochaetaceae bacterium]|nr:hypothetical protein [Spirochaetaceae bacterium]